MDELPILLLALLWYCSICFIVHSTCNFENCLHNILHISFFVSFSSCTSFCISLYPICLHLSTRQFQRSQDFKIKVEKFLLENFSYNFYHTVEHCSSLGKATNTISMVFERKTVWQVNFISSCDLFSYIWMCLRWGFCAYTLNLLLYNKWLQ